MKTETTISSGSTTGAASRHSPSISTRLATMLLRVIKVTKGPSEDILKAGMLQQGSTTHSAAVIAMEGMPKHRAYTRVVRFSRKRRQGEMARPPVSTNWRKRQSDLRFHHYMTRGARGKEEGENGAKARGHRGKGGSSEKADKSAA